MEMNNILILGANGMLGQSLVDVFSDHNIIAWDINDLDITNKEDVTKKITELSPDLIINAVGINAVDNIEVDQKLHALAQNVNGDAVLHLANVCNQLEVPLVHYSSDYIFDGELGKDLDEEAVTNPQSKYAETKLLGEQHATTADKHYVIRLSRLFGKPGAAEISKKSFVQTMIDLSKDRDSLSIIDDEVASITYAPDLATYTKQLVDQKNNYEYGIYHGSNDGGASWYDWAEQVFTLKNIDISLTKVKGDTFNRAAKRPKHSTLKNTKGPKQRHWKDALKEFLV
mgnify:FL=1